MRVAFNMAVAQENWWNAAQTADNLSYLQLSLGEVNEAIALAEQEVYYSDRSGDDSRRSDSWTALANRWHQAGERARAEELFRNAERLQAKTEAGYPRLYSHRGHAYCDLLLDLGRRAEVRDRAAYAIVIAQRYCWLLDIALDHLSFGWAELLAHEADSSGNLTEAETHLNHAVDGLRKAGDIAYIPHGLLARAAYFRVTKQHDRARRDLDEAMRIATRSGMRLHKCDAHLECARLGLAQGNGEAARTHLTSAEELVATTGYHRRDKDLEELKTALS